MTLVFGKEPLYHVCVRVRHKKRRVLLNVSLQVDIESSAEQSTSRRQISQQAFPEGEGRLFFDRDPGVFRVNDKYFRF